jgi:hypothetical protein
MGLMQLTSKERRSWLPPARLVVCAVASSFVVAFTLDAQSTVDLRTLQACTEGDVVSRQNAINSLDIVPMDLMGHKIGFTHASDNWFPHSSVKETVCGKLHQFKAYTEGGDGDWAFNIIPYSPYDEMLDAAIEAGGNAVCSGKCVHAEIQPDQSFPTDDFFRIVNRNSNYEESEVIGDSICVYGPWLKDTNHDDKPEIHPAEFVWWRERASVAPFTSFGITTAVYHAMMIQDDKNSFDRESDYTGECISITVLEITFYSYCADVPTAFRPWSKVPRLSELRIAFDADASGNSLLSYAISERYSRKVGTSRDPFARRDQGDGKVYSIQLGGVPVLKVKELQPDDHLGVLFEALCFAPEVNHVRGFITLRSRYGTGDRGGEGYQVLDIARVDTDVRLERVREGLRSLGITPLQANDSVVSRLIEQFRPRRVPDLPTPRFEFVGPVRLVDGGLVADIAVGPSDDSLELPPLLRAALRGGRNDKLLPIEPGILSQAVPRVVPSGTLVARAVPFVGSDVVRVEWKGGSYEIAIPKLALYTRVASNNSLGAHLQPEATSTFAAAAHVRQTPMSKSLLVIHAPSSMSLFRVRYAPLMEEGVGIEDQITLTRSFNRQLDLAERAGAMSKRQTVYGNAPPNAVSWDFAATNLSKAHKANVRTSAKAALNEIAVQTFSLPSGGLAVRVQFPRTGSDIYRLDLTARIRDPFGIRGVARHTVWSHHLPFNDGSLSELVGISAKLASLSSADSAYLVHVALDDSQEISARRKRDAYANVFAGFANAAVVDRQVTPAELERLVRLAAAVRPELPLRNPKPSGSVKR